MDPSGGIILNDPGNTPGDVDGNNAGSLDEFDPTDGRNLVIVTYDLEVLSSAQPGAVLSSDATLYNFAGAEGGVDFTTVDLTDDASTTVQLVGIAKTITGTSEPTTTGTNVTVGETVTYTATITVPEGGMQAAIWTDTPDANLSIVGITSITASPALAATAGTITGLTPTIGTDGDDITINFGNLTNSDRDNTSAETIVIEYDAIVINSAANSRGATAGNETSLTWAIGSADASAADITIVEPSLVIDKTITPATGQAATIFDVVIDVRHTAASDADAFDLVLTDVLPMGLTYYDVNETVRVTDGVAADSLTHVSGTITASFATLADGAFTEISFQVEADPDVIAGSMITNTADVAWTTLPGDVTTPQSTDSISTERTGDTGDPGASENDHRASDSAIVNLDAPVVTKTLDSTNQAHTSGNEVAIGEIATYEVTFNVPGGTMPDAEFVDTPDPGLAIVEIISITADAGLSTDVGTFADVQNSVVLSAGGTAMTLDFGEISNTEGDPATTENIRIRYRAVVLNSVDNDRGDVLDNTGTLTWATGSSSVGDGPDLEIVEPELQVAVSQASRGPVDAGDTVDWTVTFSHTPGSDADAFDVNLQNLIDSVGNHLTYAPGTGMLVVSDPSTMTIASQDFTGGLNAQIDTIPLGETVTWTFQTTVDDTVPASTNLVNEAFTWFTSLPGDVSAAQSPGNAESVERFGVAPGASSPAVQNDHDADGSGFVASAAPQSTKAVAETSRTDTGSSAYDAGITDVAIGEQVTYDVTAIIPEGTNDLTIVDNLPPTMELISASVVSTGGSLTVGTPTITIDDRDTDGSDDRVTFEFGQVINTSDGVVNANDTVVVRVVGRVRDVVANANGDTLVNEAAITIGAGSTTASAEVEVVEPVLEITKESPLSSGPPGTIEEFTVTIAHAGSSTATAYDLLIADLLGDPNLTLVPGTVSTSAGTIVGGNAPGDTTVSLSHVALAQGETITVTYQAIVNPSLAAGVNVDTPATIGWDGTPGPGGRSGNDSDPEPFTTTTPEVDLAVTIDDASVITITETDLVYTVVVTNNGPSTATGVEVVSLIDSDLTSSGGNTVTTAIGTLLPGESQSFTITTQTPAAVPMPDIVTSSATVAADQTETNSSNNNDDDETRIVLGARVAGRSWVDLNQDGIVDGSETVLPGVELRLTGTDSDGNSVQATTVTDSFGNYLFDRLSPGTYQVQQIQPTLFVDGADFLGTGSTHTQAGNDVFEIAVVAGDDETGYDFTERGLAPQFLGKRRLLRSRIASAGGISPFDADDFFAAFHSGRGDFDGDGDTDNDDYLIFQDRLGAPFQF